MKNKNKILLCAYACEPGSSSEQEIGWKWSNLLSEFNDVHVLTRLSNKKTIGSFINEHKLDTSIHFIYYDLPDWARKWKKAERGLYLYYTLWQCGAFLKARSINKVERFDIVHYLTFGSILLPNFMFLMPSKFVLGPVGGGENTPLRFIGEFSYKGKIAEVIRHTIQQLQKINPFFFLECYKANKILVRTKETYKMIPSFFRNKTDLMLETGVPEELLDYETKSVKDTEYIKIITVGRFIHSKINILTLKVILDFKNKYNIPFKFYIVGDGHERKKLERFCRDNNLDNNVVFTGWVSRKEVFSYLSKSDIYYSTTFKEGGSWAFFEAVAMGLPVACLRISGSDMIVADGCGIKVYPTNPEQVIDELSKGLYELSTNTELRAEFADKAKQSLLETMTWKKMMTRIEGIYKEVSPNKQ
jgi:glycosyltransferase involved in cell wall biosynthesis